MKDTQKKQKQRNEGFNFLQALLFSGILLIFLTIAILFFAGFSYIINKPYNSACEDIGFERYLRINGIEACEDKDGNIHYMKMTSKGSFYLEAKPISVGGVRTIK